MTASIAIIQYQKKEDAYALRIGNELIMLPSKNTDKIGAAIGKVGDFNTEHAMIAHDIWDGKLECDPDVFEVS